MLKQRTLAFCRLRPCLSLHRGERFWHLPGRAVQSEQSPRRRCQLPFLVCTHTVRRLHSRCIKRKSIGQECGLFATESRGFEEEPHSTNFAHPRLYGYPAQLRAAERSDVVKWPYVLISFALAASVCVVAPASSANAIGHHCVLGPGANLVGCNLSDKNIGGDLGGANFTDAKLGESNLSGNFTRANFTGADFVGQLNQGKLTGNFTDANFTRANMASEILSSGGGLNGEDGHFGESLRRCQLHRGKNGWYRPWKHTVPGRL